jgi:hypothetical protein
MHSEDFIIVCSVIIGQELVESAHAQSGKIHHCQATRSALTENYVNASERVNIHILNGSESCSDVQWGKK